ncbi:peptidase S24 [Pluralibacter gergoviae]|nr:peptidase S24 [Pluralibacter gergoviae]
MQHQHIHGDVRHVDDRVKTCQMLGDSMYPTIEPNEMVALVGCGGEITAAGIYAYSCMFFGNECLFIKRVLPLENGGLQIIHDNPAYLPFDFSPEEVSRLTIHGRVVASMKVQRFV